MTATEPEAVGAGPSSDAVVDGKLGGYRVEQAPRVAIEYCTVRIIPDIERGECLNVGVLVICRPTRFLDVRISLDADRLTALAPWVDADDVELIAAHLDSIQPICAGAPNGGPIAGLSLRERWHWLTAPASTVVQAGPIHTALSAHPAAELDRLFRRLVQLGR